MFLNYDKNVKFSMAGAFVTICPKITKAKKWQPSCR